MIKAGNTWVSDGDAYFANYFQGSDTFEQANLDLALSFVKKFDVAVDCGAHVGSWTRYMSSKFDFVAAFEPNPANYECLLLNAPFNNVVPFPMGLSDSTGNADLAGGNNSGCWHVVPGDSIKLITLPDFGALDFIKIDVEGLEDKVIRGAIGQIRKYRPIVLIEEKNLPHKPLDYSARSILELNGYKELAKSGRDVIFGY